MRAPTLVAIAAMLLWWSRATLADPPTSEDPPGCFEVSPLLTVTLYRADGVNGIVGSVSECETVNARVELRKEVESDTICAFGGGSVSLITPDGVDHPITANVPCLGGSSGGCDPTTDSLLSSLITYDVSLADRPALGECHSDADCDASSECLAGVCRGALRFTARYSGGATFGAGGLLPLGERVAFAIAPLFACEEYDPCTEDVCDPSEQGAAACMSVPVVCAGPGPCAPPCAADCSACVSTLIPVCGNGAQEDGEACDLGRAGNGAGWSCCTAGCSLRTVGQTCRQVAGACDLPESCDGSGGLCPPDLVAPAAQVCRPSSGPCDVADRCNGADRECPGVDLKLVGVVCRPATDACDVAEQCDGQSPACPSVDQRAARGTRCGGGARGFCDGAGACLETCGNDQQDEGEACDGKARPSDAWCTVDCRLTACDWEEVGTALLADLQTLICSLSAPVDGGACEGESTATAVRRVNDARDNARKKLTEVADAPEARRVRALRSMRLRLNKLGKKLLGDECTNAVLSPAVLTWTRLIEKVLIGYRR